MSPVEQKLVTTIQAMFVAEIERQQKEQLPMYHSITWFVANQQNERLLKQKKETK